MSDVTKTTVIKSGNRLRHGFSIAALVVAAGMPAFAQEVPLPASEPVQAPQEAQTVLAGPQADQDQAAQAAAREDRIVVTARRVEEDLQTVPIPVSVLSEQILGDSGAFNVGRLRELVPSVQFISQNPRNSAVTIRGLGSPYGLTNDGIEQGVGLYIDGVYHARPAAAVMDFIDVEQVEVLRGPQGTLYGKNTTAGAINVTTKQPEFTPSTDIELTYGNYGFIQAKGTTTGPLTDTLAYRASFSGTQRDGVLYNIKGQDDLNDINNIGGRIALLWKPSDTLDFVLSADNTVQRPEGYALVFAGVAPTLRAANRQYAAQAAFFNYAPPSTNPFDRVTDLDTPHRSYSDLGGVSLTANWAVGPGELTSISAWRYWIWDPSNDRDYLGLPITTLSQNPSKQFQWQQEFRYAGDFSENLSYVGGLFWFNQVTKTLGRQEQGSAAWRFLLNPTAAEASTPGLLDGYGQKTDIRSDHTSAALFGQVEWKVTDKLRLIPGIRLNYDEKEGHYIATTYGGLGAGATPTITANRLARQLEVLFPQNYSASGDENKFTYNLTAAYDVTDTIHSYATYSTAFKTFGLNSNGLYSGAPASLLKVPGEDVKHFELGLKTEPFDGVTANLTAYRTQINDFQASVVNGQAAVLRGYIANVNEVIVQGAEFDATARLGDNFNLYANVAYTDAKYEDFKNAPPALEDSGGAIVVVDASGTRLPGVSLWAASFGGEYTQPGNFSGRSGEFFAAADVSYRSTYSASPTDSTYLNIDGYSILNVRAGFRADDNWDVFAWARNALDEEYFDLLTAGSSSSGYYAGAVGDPKTYGVTLRGSF